MIIKLAGIPIETVFVHDDLLPLFSPFETDEPAIAEVSVTPGEIESVRGNYSSGLTDENIEYLELCSRYSDILLDHGRAIFHGTAFIWRDKAWIFTGPSGMGKTTQYVLWKMLFKDDVQIINGDKPVLDFTADTIEVYPSPWKGKEGMGQPLHAPLGGVILLRQSKYNRVSRNDAAGAINQILQQLMFDIDDKPRFYAAFDFAMRLLRDIPVWTLENDGTFASAELCRDALMPFTL